MKNSNHKKLFLLTACMLMMSGVFAHVVVDELEKMSKTQVAFTYLKMGFLHILPSGLDHILFVLSLFLLSPKLKPLLLQCTAFTVAHSVTLGLAMYNVVNIPSIIIEPLISLSIIFVAVENIFSQRLKKTRLALVFLFGLVHGLGFASSLSAMGLPEQNKLITLVLFNVGVELGQITVILSAFFLVGKWLGDKPIYRKAVVLPGSLIIASVAAVWTIQRIFFV